MWIFGFGEQKGVGGVCWHTVQLHTCVSLDTFCASIDTRTLCVVMFEINDLFSVCLNFTYIAGCGMWLQL